MLCLVVSYQDSLRRFPLPAEKAVLGSSSSSDIVVTYPGISRRHAEVLHGPEGVLLRDLASKNGLFLEGRRESEVRLERGVMVGIGRAFITLDEASTSDLELALELSNTKRAASSTGVETSPDSSDTDPGASAEALRFIRQVEQAGPRRLASRRGQFLAQARGILGAVAVVVISIEDSEDPSVLHFDGALPSEKALRQLARMAGGTGGAKTSGRGRSPQPMRVELSSGESALMAATSGRQGQTRQGAVAVLFPDPGIPEWKSDFFGYLAQKLLSPGSDQSPEMPAIPEEPGPLRFPPEMIVGNAPAMRGLFAQLQATVRSGLDVLLLGETGTGKELYAQMIHASGPTPQGPFVAINCAAIPHELLESELFGIHGHVATGVDAKQGLLLQAEGGTIFLDEVGELAEPLQAKLLRFLQEREVHPVGARAPQKVSLRVISASNRDLPSAAHEGRFRADLFYRLRCLQFHIPPLRERPEDIPNLVLAFAERAAAEHGKRIRGVSRKALSLLVEHDWPGNVRELQMEVQRAVLVCHKGGSLRAEHFATVRYEIERMEKARRAPEAENGRAVAADGPAVAPTDPRPSSPETLSLRQRIDAVEREAIDEALKAAAGNKSLAARFLGITRNGLVLKLARLGGRSGRGKAK